MQKSELASIKTLLTALNVKNNTVCHEEKASPHYWSGGDSFCSLQDKRAATDWIENETAAWLIRELKRRGWRAPVKRRTVKQRKGK